MDDRRFDLFARSFAAASTRRGLVASLFAVLGLAAPDDSGAEPSAEHR